MDLGGSYHLILYLNYDFRNIKKVLNPFDYNTPVVARRQLVRGYCLSYFTGSRCHHTIHCSHAYGCQTLTTIRFLKRSFPLVYYLRGIKQDLGTLF